MVLIKSACTTGTGTSRSMKYEKLLFWGGQKIFRWPDFWPAVGWGGEREREREEREWVWCVCVLINKNEENGGVGGIYMVLKV